MKTNPLSRLGFAVFGAVAGLAAANAIAADTIQIAVPPKYAPMAIVMLAQQEGYFKEKNIDAIVTTYRGGAAVQEALAAGAADVAAVASPGAAMAIQKGVKQKIVALAGPTSPQGWFLIVRRDSQIKSAKDLNGKKVGITGKASSTDFFSLGTAREAGVTIQSIPLGAGILPALKAKQIDAGVIWPMVSYQAVFSGEYRLIADYGSVNTETSMDVWVASQNIIDRDPDLLKRWMEALNKAVKRLQGDEKFALAFLAKYHEESDVRALKATYDGLLRTLRPDSAVKPEWLENALKLAAAGGVSGLPHAVDILDRRFVPAAAR